MKRLLVLLFIIIHTVNETALTMKRLLVLLFIIIYTRKIESCWKLLPFKFTGQGLCLRNKYTDLIHSYVLDVVKVLLVSSVSLIETVSLTVYMIVNNANYDATTRIIVYNHIYSQ
jgi:hypothetical protein